MKGQCGENCCRRKTAPAKKGAGEKFVPPKKNFRQTSRRKILPAKFAAINARRQNCRGILLRRDRNFEMAKFRVIFEGPHCTVVVGGEKRAEIFSPPETLCLQVQKFHRKIHYKSFTAPNLPWLCPFTDKWF